MEFTNAFTVAAPVEDVWPIMLDAESVAPCVPGAQITETLDSTHYRGIVKVKLGAVQMSYRGELEMMPDEATKTIVLSAKGTEMRGSGGASGTFSIKLSPTESGGTHVELHTVIDVTGRVAQFGRGIMQDVASRMIKDFARCLEQTVEAPVSVDQTDSPPGRDPNVSVSREGLAHTSVASGPSVAGSRPNAVPPVSTSAAGSGVSSIERGADNELRLGRLFADLARGQLAAALRAAAKWIEPR